MLPHGYFWACLGANIARRSIGSDLQRRLKKTLARVLKPCPDSGAGSGDFSSDITLPHLEARERC